MKKGFQIIAAISLLVFAACKKEKQSPAQSRTLQIATTRQTIYNGQPYDFKREFIYDGEGRLKEIRNSGTHGGGKTEKYSYSETEVQCRYFVGGIETVPSPVIFKLNGRRLADRAVYNYPDTYGVYEYNNEGYLTHFNFFTGGVVTAFQKHEYTGGNILDSTVGLNSNAGTDYVYTFSYETGRRNTIGEQNKGVSMLGKDQPAPLKQRIFYTYQLPGHEGKRVKYYETNFEYEYDSEGRIKKHKAIQTQYNPNGTSNTNILEVVEYTYRH